jgi:DNA repair protein RecN (Recombination protein N)
MLERLSVRNLVVIREADLELAPGLNVITGETGAGKTIVTGALDLVLGGRADASLVGPSGPEAYAEAAFTLPPGMLERDAFAGVRDLAGDDDEPLLLARRITPEGRARALCCGRSTTRAALEAAGAELVSVVSQHEARELTRPAVQRALLDAFAGPEQPGRLAEMATAWRALAEASRARQEAENDAAGAERVADDLADLVRRVEAVAPDPAEPDALRAERERLRHADTLLQAAGGAAHHLDPDDGEGALTQAGLAVRTLAAGEGFDPDLAAVGMELRDAVTRLEEAARALHSYAAAVEHDPGRIEQVERRLADLDDLAARHGSVEGALAAAEAARDRLERLESRDADLERLRALEEAARADVRAAADAVAAARRAAAGPFARAVERHLGDLGMAEARVDVQVDAREPGATGADDVRFLVAPNPGVGFGSVADTASGGELSRISLAIRVAAQESSGVPLLVFDEVDAGVGGRTARVVGEMLRALATTAQVVCITHLAQIAALADRHFRVVKEPGDPTVTSIEQLTGAAVEVELARMLGGEESSEEALQLARALRT